VDKERRNDPVELKDLFRKTTASRFFLDSRESGRALLHRSQTPLYSSRRAVSDDVHRFFKKPPREAVGKISTHIVWRSFGGMGPDKKNAHQSHQPEPAVPVSGGGHLSEYFS